MRHWLNLLPAAVRPHTTRPSYPSPVPATPRPDQATPARLETLEPRMLLSGDLPVILGDYNGSGQVEQGDLDLVLSNWGRNFVDEEVAVPSAWVVDLPGDQIEQGDLDAVLGNWGTTVPAGAPDGGLKALTSGETVHSDIGTNTDVDTYTIDLEAGDSLLLSIREAANTFSYMRASLFGPDGVIVEQESFQTGDDLDQIAVTQTGTYKVVVSDYYGTSSGAYSLTAVVIDDAVDVDNVALTSGQTVTGTVDQADLDTFTIDAQAGDSLLVSIRENANTFSYMEAWLFGPDGSLIERADFQTGDDLDQINLAQSGTYTIVVHDFYDVATGDYSLTAVVIDDVVDVDNVALTSGQMVTGTVDQADLDTFTIDAQAGDSLLVSIRENANTFSYMEAWLFGPDGSLIERTDFQTGDDLDQINLAQSGTYTIVVHDFYDAATGDYSLTAVVADGVVDADNVELVSGQSTGGTIGLADLDTFTINAQAGQDLLISISEDSNTFSYMEAWLFGPGGTFIERTDFQTSGDLNQFNLAQGGTYTIVVHDFYDAATGGYHVTATAAFPPAVSAPSRVVRMTAPVTLPEEQATVDRAATRAPSSSVWDRVPGRTAWASTARR